MNAFRPIVEPLNRPVKLAALISGGGTTVINLQERIAAGTLNAEIAVVVASRADCAGIEKAQSLGLQVEIAPRAAFESVASFSQVVFEMVEASRADLVVLAGFLCLLEIPDRFRMRVMNIHPGLIPAFSGKGYHGRRVHEAALARGVKVSGCTVHFADNEYDHGPIVVQRTVPVLDNDDATTLAARVFEAECEAYPEAIRQFAAGAIEIVEGRVRVRPAN